MIPAIVKIIATDTAMNKYKFLRSESPIPAAPNVNTAEPGAMNMNVYKVYGSSLISVRP